eukprot:m.136065 g.136065  ORF g.136065 m.136065 type:complete len:73 (+) comp16965_c1_seq7:401-619(+)
MATTPIAKKTPHVRKGIMYNTTPSNAPAINNTLFSTPATMSSSSSHNHAVPALSTAPALRVRWPGRRDIVKA